MAQQVRNVDYTLAGAVTANVGTTPSNLDDGEIRVFPASGTMGALTAGDSFFIACGNGTTTAGARFISQVIDPAKVSIATRRHNTPAIEQQDSIGYDGTSGSLEALNNNLYLVRMYIQEMLTSSSDGAVIKHFQYKSDASAIQSEIALGLAKSAINNFSKEATEYVTFKALVSSAVVVGNDFNNALSWAKGSKTFQCASAVYGGGTAVVGDYIRLHASDATVVLTDDTYKITAISGTTITVDRPIQVAAYTDTGNNNAGNEVITAAVGDAANWGVDLQGQPLDYSIGKLFYKQARWVLGLEDFGTSTSAQPASAFGGVGVYREAADAEWFCAGFEGEPYRMGEPAIHNYVSKASAAATYDVFSIRWIEDSVVSFQGEVSPMQITIYANAASNYVTNAAAAGGIRLQLEAAIAASKLSATAGVAGSGVVTSGGLA